MAEDVLIALDQWRGVVNNHSKTMAVQAAKCDSKREGIEIVRIKVWQGPELETYLFKDDLGEFPNLRERKNGIPGLWHSHYTGYKIPDGLDREATRRVVTRAFLNAGSTVHIPRGAP